MTKKTLITEKHLSLVIRAVHFFSLNNRCRKSYHVLFRECIHFSAGDFQTLSVIGKLFSHNSTNNSCNILPIEAETNHKKILKN